MRRTGGVPGTSDAPTAAPQRRWTSVHDQYKTIEILGQGTYGVVYKAEHKGTGELVAMKRCRLDAFREFGIPETTLREIALLRDLRHENIMTLYHVSCNTERLYLICEFIDLDLKKYIRSRNRGIPIRKVKEITFELFKGLAFCHGHRVIHRDLKPHNVLVSSDVSKVKIADFGLARSALAPGKTLTHEVVTLWYRAPELLLGHCNYSSGVDIWSVGCIIAELLNSKPLYVGDSELDTLFKIFRLLGTPQKEDWPEHAVVPWSDFPQFAKKADPFGFLTPGLDDAGKDLLARTFKFNSDERISALDALQHPWLAEVREDAEAAGQTTITAECECWDADEGSTVPTSAYEDVPLLDRPVVETPDDLMEPKVEFVPSRKSVEIEIETGKKEAAVETTVPAAAVSRDAYNDVALMAQRMKELEEKLKEVERQRIDLAIPATSVPPQPNKPGPPQPQEAPLPQRIPSSEPSTSCGVPTRPTTATSSPTAAKNNERRREDEDSTTRRHRARRNTTAVDETHHPEAPLPSERPTGSQQPTQQQWAPNKPSDNRPDNQQANQDNRQANQDNRNPGQKASGMFKATATAKGKAGPPAREWELLGRFRRSSLANLIDRRRRKDMISNEPRPEQGAKPNQSRQPQASRRDPQPQQPNESKRRVNERRPMSSNPQEGRDIDNIDGRRQPNTRYPPQDIGGRHAMAPPSSCHSRDEESARYSAAHRNDSRNSLPSGGWQQWGWGGGSKREAERRGPPPRGFQGGDPYDLQRQYYQQPQGRRRPGKHQQNPGYQPYQHMGSGGSTDGSSLLRRSLPHDPQVYGRATAPPSNHRSTVGSSGGVELGNSFGHSGGPVNSNGSSVWAARDLNLDVECSFNWTTNPGDDVYRQRHRPTFQPSTYQGMMMSSDDRWKRSSSYGGSGVKESIARLNLKFAANASLCGPGESSHHSRHQSFGRYPEEQGWHDNGYKHYQSTSRHSLGGRHPFDLSAQSRTMSNASRLSLMEFNENRQHALRDPYDVSLWRHTLEAASVTRRE